MIRILFSVLKVLSFAALILILSHRIEWGGKSLSDQVRHQMSHAENSEVIKEIRKMSEKIVHDVKEGAIRQFRSMDEPKESATSNGRSGSQSARSFSSLLKIGRSLGRKDSDGIGSGDKPGDNDDEFTESERQKLRALIRELNDT